MNTRPFALLVAACATAATAHAAFHIMQIEQIIGGLDGDSTAQAIQLRLRGGGQSVIGNGRIRAWDANGANPIVLLDPTTNVTNGTLGDNVLFATASFNMKMSGVAGYSSDFTLANVIPAAYLTGGKITWESNGGLIYCSVAFGNYVGTNLGETTNDADGNFGAPFPNALPTAVRQGIRFTGASNALSTTNAADYAFTSNPATVRNNARSSFTVVPEPGSAALLALCGLGAIAFARRRS
jgi:hypothetical protein